MTQGITNNNISSLLKELYATQELSLLTLTEQQIQEEIEQILTKEKNFDDRISSLETLDQEEFSDDIEQFKATKSSLTNRKFKLSLLVLLKNENALLPYLQGLGEKMNRIEASLLERYLKIDLSEQLHNIKNTKSKFLEDDAMLQKIGRYEEKKITTYTQGFDAKERLGEKYEDFAIYKEILGDDFVQNILEENESDGALTVINDEDILGPESIIDLTGIEQFVKETLRGLSVLSTLKNAILANEYDINVDWNQFKKLLSQHKGSTIETIHDVQEANKTSVPKVKLSSKEIKKAKAALQLMSCISLLQKKFNSLNLITTKDSDQLSYSEYLIALENNPEKVEAYMNTKSKDLIVNKKNVTRLVRLLDDSFLDKRAIQCIDTKELVRIFGDIIAFVNSVGNPGKDDYMPLYHTHIDEIIGFKDQIFDLIQTTLGALKTNNVSLAIAYYEIFDNVLGNVFDTIGHRSESGAPSYAGMFLYTMRDLISTDLYDEYKDTFSVNTAKLVASMKNIPLEKSEAGESITLKGWLLGCYTMHNSMLQKHVMRGYTQRIFDTGTDEISQEGWVSIADEYKNRLSGYAIASKLFQHPEVFYPGYGIKDDETMFWLKPTKDEHTHAVVFLSDLDGFRMHENWSAKVDDLFQDASQLTEKERDTIQYFESPLPQIIESGLGFVGILANSTVGAFCLHKNRDLSVNGYDSDDLKFLLGSQGYHMLQAYLLFHILESHELIDKTKEHPMLQTARPESEYNTNGIVYKDPRVVYNQPEVRNSGIKKYIPFRSEAFVRYSRKKDFDQQDFDECRKSSTPLRMGIFEMRDSKPVYKHIEFSINKLPIPAELMSYMTQEERSIIKQVGVNTAGYIETFSDFNKVQKLVINSVKNTGKVEGPESEEILKCYPMFYRSEHRKPGVNPKKKIVYKLGSNIKNSLPIKTKNAKLDKFLKTCDDRVKNIVDTLEALLCTCTKQYLDGKIYYYDADDVVCSLSFVLHTVHLQSYADISEDTDSSHGESVMLDSADDVQVALSLLGIKA